MRKLIRRITKKAGLPPGSLEYVGEVRREPPKLTVMTYGAQQVEEREVAAVEECIPVDDASTTTWVSVAGVHEAEIISKLGACYEIHPLVLEDILNTQQRPKLEDFERYVFVVVKLLRFDEDANELAVEQVSLVVMPTAVISFQETTHDLFGPVRARIRNGRGRIRTGGVDYLAYALLDAVVDNYFAILEQLAGQIEGLEDHLVSDPSPETLNAIYKLKREMIFLRRSVWPLREVLSGLTRGGSDLIKETTVPYLRDVYDHTIQVIDTTESFRDVVSGMHDTYLSSISNRMNEVMKVLTIIATIFIPLTFLAGIYGMNFEYMPELRWHWAYAAVWVVMGVVTVAMIVYFRKRRWL